MSVNENKVIENLINELLLGVYESKGHLDDTYSTRAINAFKELNDKINETLKNDPIKQGEACIQLRAIVFEQEICVSEPNYSREKRNNLIKTLGEYLNTIIPVSDDLLP